MGWRPGRHWFTLTFAEKMRRLLFIIVILFLVGTVSWKAFDGRWESRYSTQEGSYLMDLDSQPLWDRPSSPSFADFTEHFSSTSLPGSGEISVYHKWDWWLLDVFVIWLIVSLVVTPISFLASRRDPVLGVFARVGAGLITSALACFLFWLVVGGWGPPAPLFFAVIGLAAGGIWASAYAKNVNSEQGSAHQSTTAP